MNTITMTRSETQESQQIKLSFSWTTLFFGFWPSIFRGDIKHFFMYVSIEMFYYLTLSALLLAALDGGATPLWTSIVLYMLLVFPISKIVYAYYYNILYAQLLVDRGYEPVDVESRKILLRANIRL